MKYEMLSEFVKSFIALFVVMDAIGNAPIFLSLTNKMGKDDSIKRLNKAVLVAAFLIFLFVAAGNSILSFFGIHIGDFQIAGGIIFIILGIEMVFGLDFLSNRVENYDIAVVPLATPLIAGPGVLTTVVVLTATYGYIPTIVAVILNLITQRLILGNSIIVTKLFGKQGAELLSRIMGIVLTALAISFIRSGVISIIAEH
jgi:multiple antibiotic resistance protein